MPLTLAWEGAHKKREQTAENLFPDDPWDLLSHTEPHHGFSGAKNGGRGCNVSMETGLRLQPL